MILKRTIIALGGMLAFGTSLASAADVVPPLPPITYTPPPVVYTPPTAPDWRGVYIGFVGAYTWGEAEMEINVDPVVPFRGPEVGFLIGANAVVADRLIFGPEIGLNKSWEQGFYETFWEKYCDTFVQTDTFAIDWIGTARVRAGFLVTPRVLIYGAVGLAFGMVDLTTTVEGTNKWDETWIDYAAVGRAAGVGPTFAIGAEVMLGERVTFRVEYNRTRLNLFNISTGYATTFANAVDQGVTAGFTIHF